MDRGALAAISALDDADALFDISNLAVECVAHVPDQHCQCVKLLGDGLLEFADRRSEEVCLLAYSFFRGLKRGLKRGVRSSRGLFNAHITLFELRDDAGKLLIVDSAYLFPGLLDVLFECGKLGGGQLLQRPYLTQQRRRCQRSGVGFRHTILFGVFHFSLPAPKTPRLSW